MKVTWTNVGSDHIDIWATTVYDDLRLNITATHANVHPFKWFVRRSQKL